MGLPLFNRFVPYKSGIAPSGQFGFNPNHPASLTARISIVATANGAMNLLTNQFATPTATAPTNANGPLGPYRVPTSSHFDKFPNFYEGTDQSCTMACIFNTPSSFATAQTLLQADLAPATSTWQFNVNTSGKLVILKFGGTAIACSIALSASTPYFALMTVNGDTASRFAFTNLITGQVTLAAGATPTGTATASGGTFVFGANGTAASQAATGGIYSGYYGSSFMPQATHQQWAQSPFSFWRQDM